MAHSWRRVFPTGTCTIFLIIFFQQLLFHHTTDLLFHTEAKDLHFSPQDVPNPPEKLFVYSLNESTVLVQINLPAHMKAEGSNGAPIIGYRVELAKSMNGVHEFLIERDQSISSGAYKLKFTGSSGTQETPCIQWNASALEFQIALEELTYVDSILVNQTSFSTSNKRIVWKYNVAFDEPCLLSDSEPQLLQADCQKVEPLGLQFTLSSSKIVAGTADSLPQVWQVTTDANGADILDGYFDLSIGFDGDWTAIAGVMVEVNPGSNIAITSSSLIGVINRGDYVKLGDEVFIVHRQAPFTDTNLPLHDYHMLGVASGGTIYALDTAIGSVRVTSGSASILTGRDLRGELSVDEYIRIGPYEFRITGFPSATTVILSDAWNGASTHRVTAYRRKRARVSVSSSADELKAAMESLAGTGIVEVSRYGPNQKNEFVWLISFMSLNAYRNCPASPCLHAHKLKGESNYLLKDAYGVVCTTCRVVVSSLQRSSNGMSVSSISPSLREFTSSSVVTAKEVNGYVNEIQSIIVYATNDDLRGSFSVYFRSNLKSAILEVDDTAKDVRTKLEQLPAIGRVNVERIELDGVEKGGSKKAIFGVKWLITFLSNIGDLPSMSISSSQLSGEDATVDIAQVIKGVETPSEMVLSGLEQNTRYAVRGFTRSTNGYSSGTDTIQMSGKGAVPYHTTPGRSPDPPTIINVWPISNSEIALTFASREDRGFEVQRYELDYIPNQYSGTATVNKIYIKSTLEDNLSGRFRLQYGRFTTSMFTVETDATSMELALNKLPKLRPVSVSRDVYILTGNSSSCVTGIDISSNMLLTTPLTAKEVELLIQGSTITVAGTSIYVVASRPAVGSTSISILAGYENMIVGPVSELLKADESGSVRGPHGYQWLITFPDAAGDIIDSEFPGLQITNNELTFIQSGTKVNSLGISNMITGTTSEQSGMVEISTDISKCDTYTIGAPSSVQILQLFAKSTITQGSFKLRFGSEITPNCITLGQSFGNIKSTLRQALESLRLVSRVSVEELRQFKVTVLTGSSSSKVSAYTTSDGLTGTLTIVSTGVNYGLDATKANQLLPGAIVQVIRSSKAFKQQNCEFRIVSASVNDPSITVAVPSNARACESFQNEARSLRLLDFNDYKIRFWGSFPYGDWPSISIVSSEFGSGSCTSWVPPIPVYSKVHTVRYEGFCASGSTVIHSIFADGSSNIGGHFTLSYSGKHSEPLDMMATAERMRIVIQELIPSRRVQVGMLSHGEHGKSWLVTFTAFSASNKNSELEDTLFIKQPSLTGKNAAISVFPIFQIRVVAIRNDISGSFQLSMNGEKSELIGYHATNAKVEQELNKMTCVNSVVALGRAVTQDPGVYPLQLSADVSNTQVVRNIRVENLLINPSLCLAFQEIIHINQEAYRIQDVTEEDITLDRVVPITATGIPIQAGTITKTIVEAPGYFRLGQNGRVLNARRNSVLIEVSVKHRVVVGSTLYIFGSGYTANSVNGGHITITPSFSGQDIVSGTPESYCFDNVLHTTKNLVGLIQTGDYLWIANSPQINVDIDSVAVSGDLLRCTVQTVESNRVLVNGIFKDSFWRRKAFVKSFGRQWSLAFRSYTGDLETLSVTPGLDLRGTDIRISSSHLDYVPPNSVRIGNPTIIRRVHLEAGSSACATSDAPYELTVGYQRANFEWTDSGASLRSILRQFDGIDQIDVTTTAVGGGFLHIIKLWGTYTEQYVADMKGIMVNPSLNPTCTISIMHNSAIASNKESLILSADQTYKLQIYAQNHFGYSKSSVPISTEQLSRVSIVPSPPTEVYLGEFHGSTWLSVHYRPPIYDGGAPVTMYRVEWDSAEVFRSTSSDYGVKTIQKIAEVQLVKESFRSNIKREGTFTLSFGAHRTHPLPFDCSSQMMANALDILTDNFNIEVKPFKVTRVAVSWGYHWAITFPDVYGDAALLHADDSLLSGDFPIVEVTEIVKGFQDIAIDSFTRAVQEVITEAKSVLSGSFVLSFDGQSTSPIPVTASALEMQSILLKATTLYSIKITKKKINQALNTAIWSLTFANLRGGDAVGAGSIVRMQVMDTSQLVGTAASVSVFDKITGTDPYRLGLTRLHKNRRYHMHTAAYNEYGFGSGRSSLSTAVTCTKPDAPSGLTVSVVDGTKLAVSWSPARTESNASSVCSIDRYKIEWFRSPGTNEEQTITTSAKAGLFEIQKVWNFADSPSLTGFFKLSFDGVITDNIAWNAPAQGSDSMKTKLERLQNVGTVDVNRKSSLRVITGLMVTSVGGTAVLQRDAASSSKTIAQLHGQEIDVGEKIWVLGRMFTVISLDSSQDTITIGSSLEIIIPVPVFKNAFGFTWLITFTSGHIGPQPLLMPTPGDNWGGDNPGIAANLVSNGVSPISGTFRVGYATLWTYPISYNATAIEMKQALESLKSSGPVQVSRTRNGYGYNWIVTFIEVASDVSLLDVDGTRLQGPSVKIQSTRTRLGVQPRMYCEIDGAPGRPLDIFHPASSQVNLTRLTTGIPYIVRVRAHNIDGYGPASYPANMTAMTPQQHPGQPQNLRVISLSSRLIKSVWDSPISTGGTAILAYLIQWDTSSSFSGTNSPNFDMQYRLAVASENSSPYYYDIPILTDPSLPYHVRVYALNVMGRSEPSTDVQGVYPIDRVPGRPEQVVAMALSSTSIMVNWVAPSTKHPYFGGDGGLPITQYMVEWDSSINFDSPASFILLNGSQLSYPIGQDDYTASGVYQISLVVDNTYYIRVTAFNTLGAGTAQSSYPPSILTATQPPTVPGNLRVDVLNESTLIAEWDEPLYNGGVPLQGYIIEWDDHENMTSGFSDTTSVSVVHEMQAVHIETKVVHAEQYIDATVEVVNEQQVVRTQFSGQDEVQVIKIDGNPVIPEIQTFKTYTADIDQEEQLGVDAKDYDEIQCVRTTIPEVFEVQRINVEIITSPEIQTLAMTFTGGNGNMIALTGSFVLTFDATQCIFCKGKDLGSQSTSNLLSSLRNADDAQASQLMSDALNVLSNIHTGGVSITRTSQIGSNPVDITYVYSITFTGSWVAGDVPLLVVTNTILSGQIPSTSTETSKGRDLLYDPSSTLILKYVCEPYSDPYATSYRNSPVCDLGTNLGQGGLINQNDILSIGTCIVQVNSVTSSQLTIVSNPFSSSCSPFVAASLDIHRTQQTSIPFQLMRREYTLALASDMQTLLNNVVGSVSIQRAFPITTTSIRLVYEITFLQRTGTIPLLICGNNLRLNEGTSSSTCSVERLSIGSSIGGSFKLSLPAITDPTQSYLASNTIPWDATGSDVKRILEGIYYQQEQLFGTVNVKRIIYSPTGNKWSGGFTWVITFNKRGWDVPRMMVSNQLVAADGSTPINILVEDGNSPFTSFPTGLSRDGNQITGSMRFRFGGITSIPCIIGIHTSLDALTENVIDTKLRDFILNQFPTLIDTIIVTRSSATQARGFTWTMTFNGDLNGGLVERLGLESSLQESPVAVPRSTNAYIVVTKPGNELGGDFRLQWMGSVTDSLPYNAGALLVEEQLNSLTSIRPSLVSVSRSTENSQVKAYIWSVTFTSSVWVDPTSDHSTYVSGNWKGPRSKWEDVWPETGYSKAWGRHVGPLSSKNMLVACHATGLWTTNDMSSKHCIVGIYQQGTAPLSGSFTLQVPSGLSMSHGQAETSASISHNARASRRDSGITGTSLEEILESLPNIGDVDVSLNSFNAQTGGSSWSVTFLRDAYRPCEQLEDSEDDELANIYDPFSLPSDADPNVKHCNSPGDVPSMVIDTSQLRGSNLMGVVCETSINTASPSSYCIPFLNHIKNGQVLRGYFSLFQVQGDPGFSQRYELKVHCPNPPCTLIDRFELPAGNEFLVNKVSAGDRFTIGSFDSCVFFITAIVPGAAPQIYVYPKACAALTSTAPLPMNLLIPWNASAALVENVLESSADQSLEQGIWNAGRQVLVKRKIYGKYGEATWAIRFVANPTYTPPGSGNVAPIQVIFKSDSFSHGPQSISITETVEGSAPLAGSFAADFHSAVGERYINFNEDSKRLEAKLNEMDTVGRVLIKRVPYPSAVTGCSNDTCAGGWENRPVMVDGRRGGYRWKIRFLQSIGEYKGRTFPHGSGVVLPFTVDFSNLLGQGKQVEVHNSKIGSQPILGTFALKAGSVQSPFIPYTADANTLKQAIESMKIFGEVDVHHETLITQEIPGALATLKKDGTAASISGTSEFDIMEHLAPGDLVRFGPTSSNSPMPGTNGEFPLAGSEDSSKVFVRRKSPVISAKDDVTSRLYPGMSVRIDGGIYKVKRTGSEVQTITVSAPVSTFKANLGTSAGLYALILKRSAKLATSNCIPYDATAPMLQGTLNLLLNNINPTSGSSQIRVTRTGPLSFAGNAHRGFLYHIYFLGDTVQGDVALLTYTLSPCASTAVFPTILVDTAEQGGEISRQVVDFATDSGRVVDSLGYFRLKQGSAETPCLKWGVTAAELEAAVELHLGTGDVLVSRNGSGASITEIQILRVSSNIPITSGTLNSLFRVEWQLFNERAWTQNCLSYGVSARDLQIALNGLLSLNDPTNSHIYVTRKGDGSAAWGYGFEYHIHFKGTMRGGSSQVLGDVPALRIINVGTNPCSSLLTGPRAPKVAIWVETIRNGVFAYSYEINYLEYDKQSASKNLLEVKTSTCSTSNWGHTRGNSRMIRTKQTSFGGSPSIQQISIIDSTIVAKALKFSLDGTSIVNCLPFDFTILNLVQALESIPSIGSNGVKVVRDFNAEISPPGSSFLVTFTGDQVTGRLPLLQAVVYDATCQNAFSSPDSTISITTLLDSGQHPNYFVISQLYEGDQPGLQVAYHVPQIFAIPNPASEIQQIVVTTTSSSGFSTGDVYKLQLGSIFTTPDIAWNAQEEDLEIALGVNGGFSDIRSAFTVTRRKNAVLAPRGFVYTVYFNDPTFTGNQPLLTVPSLSTNFGSGGGTVIPTALVDGSDDDLNVKLSSNTIPLAQQGEPNRRATYLAEDSIQKIYRVNGFLWNVRFKSSIGDILGLEGIHPSSSGSKVVVTDNLVRGKKSTVHEISHLFSGIPYHVRVAASNELGLGPFSAPNRATPSGIPAEVSQVEAGPALYESEVQAVRTAATYISEVQNISTTADAIIEIQSLQTRISGPLLSNCPNGACITGSIAFRIPCVQTIIVTSFAPFRGEYVVSFERQIADSNPSNAGRFAALGSVAETIPIPWDVAADDLKDRLLQLSALNDGDIVVTRDGDGTMESQYGYTYSVTFVGNSVAGQTQLIKTSVYPDCATCDALLTVTGDAVTPPKVSMNENLAMGTDIAIQRVFVAAEKPIAMGAFYLAFTHLGASKTTTCIQHDAPAREENDGFQESLEFIFERLSNVDDVYVTRSTDSLQAPNGFYYDIYFIGNGVYGDVMKLDISECPSTPFKTSIDLQLYPNNALLSVSMIDYGGYNPANTFVSAGAGTAEQLQKDLEQLPMFGNIQVARSLSDAEGGFLWTIAYGVEDGNVPQFICGADAIFHALNDAFCDTSTLVDGNALSGFFILETSSPIPFDASPASMEAELELIDWIGDVHVERSSASPQRGYTWMVTFVEYEGDAPLLQGTNLLLGSGSAIVVDETRKGNTINGSFRLSFNGIWTAPIAANAPATTVESRSDGSSMQEKLEALVSIGKLQVERSVNAVDSEGGYRWMITFCDDIVNSGDLPLLKADYKNLSGTGALVSIKEISKGSRAVGNRVWISYNPPITYRGDPVTKYQVRWATISTFSSTATKEVYLDDPTQLNSEQSIVTGAPSLSWSNQRLSERAEIQTLTIGASGAFSLLFRGEKTSIFTVSTSKTSDISTALSNLLSISLVAVTPEAALLTPALEVVITFMTEIGDLPLLIIDNPGAASMTERQRGVTNFRKEVNVFKCSATSGSIQFQTSMAVGSSGQSRSISVASSTSIFGLQNALHTLFNVETTSITVTSLQNYLCASPVPAPVIITFHRLYGDIDLKILFGNTNLAIPEANIDGVYPDMLKATSGTFQVGYKGAFTRPLDPNTQEDDMRSALESLDKIQTVHVTREYAAGPISDTGTVDTVQGQIYVTCSRSATCKFTQAMYGVPGCLIKIGGDWYTVRSDTDSSQGLSSSRLYLGDIYGKETGYIAQSAKKVTVYEWIRGYSYHVYMLQVEEPISPLQFKKPRLTPHDAFVRIYGQACHKCYYLPTNTLDDLIIGQLLYVDVHAYNINGRGEDGVTALVAPNQIPNPPVNVEILVLSSKEIQVFFSPPAILTSSMSSNLNKDISSYLIQYDTNDTFMHGHEVCSKCATALSASVLTTTVSLQSKFGDTSNKFWIGQDSDCVLTAISVPTATRVNVNLGPGCRSSEFTGENLSLYFYRNKPVVVSGEAITGTPPFTDVVSGLVGMLTYYFRVAAVNSVPVQRVSYSGDPPNNRKWCSPLSAMTKDNVPDHPSSVMLAAFSGSVVEVQIQPPTRDGKGTGGLAITHYWIDIDKTATFDSAAKSTPTLVSASSLPAIYSGGPLLYYISGLETAVSYYVQVKAMNSIGFSRSIQASSSVTLMQLNSGPQEVNVQLPSYFSSLNESGKTITTAMISWRSPKENGGSDIESYLVEWWNLEARHEVQVLQMTWQVEPVTPVLFRLAFGGAMSGFLPHNVSPENLRSALMNLYVNGNPVIGHVKVTRTTKHDSKGYEWSITFLADQNTGDQPLIQLSYPQNSGITGQIYETTSGISISSIPTYPGKPEVQVLVISGLSPPNGFFRLSFRGSKWTNYIPAQATDNILISTLHQLPSVGRVSVSRSISPDSNSYFWKITFEACVGDQPPFIIDRSKIYPSSTFVGIKDGDNAVTSMGERCLPGDDPVTCPGSWNGFSTKIAGMATIGEASVDYQSRQTVDSSVLTHQITELKPSSTYFITVSAKTAIGVGPRVSASPAPLILPLRVPSPPKDVAVHVNPGSSTQLITKWESPENDGGTAIQMYRVQFDTSPRFDGNRGEEKVWCPAAPRYAVWSVQTARVDTTVTNPISKGYFQLNLRRNLQNFQSEPIPWNAVAMAAEEVGSSTLSQSKVFCTVCSTCTDTCDSSSVPPVFLKRESSGSMQSKLEYLPTISRGVHLDTTIPNPSGDGGFKWRITFLDAGDDYTLLPGTNALYDSSNNGGAGLYSVTTTKLVAGVYPATCTGAYAIPSSGTLNKGQFYYMRVFAYNQVGFSQPTSALNPQKPMVVPGLPTGVTTRVSGSSQLQAVFSEPDDNGGDKVTEYLVEYATTIQFTGAKNVSVTFLQNGPPYSRMISDLQKGSFYFIRVRARNSQGLGPAQIASPMSLNPSTKPGAPTNVVVGVTSSSMLTVGWDVPIDDGGDAITAYRIQWDANAMFDAWNLDANTVIITDVTVRSYTIVGLQHLATYYVRVMAQNSLGIGTPQQAYPGGSTPTSQPPGKPYALVFERTQSMGELFVSWQPPKIPAHGIPCGGSLEAPAACGTLSDSDIAFGGSSFQKYEMQCSSSTSFPVSTTLVSTTTTTTMVLNGLSSSVRYFVRILAINSEGLLSEFCQRKDLNGFHCPENLILASGSIVTGPYASEIPL
uniref:Similar to titin isoform N2B putative n=1 Tax=Albugo laibachii Nc14 TaxID=890382 RepID=F0VYU3_9STRA|nr:similar to titin isoform N2B putative [Albugo laibachii Nc14]|eukprot:CCA13958.1 similar to titin isoform N2B putative [Albugo laibachii Nc14]